MDAIYYVSCVLMVLILLALILAAFFFLVKPHHLQKSKHINKPVSRIAILAIAIAAMFTTTMSFGVVLAATEPADIKAARVARQAAEEKAKQSEAQKHQQMIDDQKKREEEAKKPIVKTETKKEAIAFESIEEEDGTLAKGETRVKTEGMDGERTITVQITYVKDKETDRKEVLNEITKAPITKVTQKGTYVAPVYTPPAPPVYSAPAHEQPTSPDAVYYKNCSAARAAGAAPVYRGQPGYGRHLDRDNDGIGCE